MQKIQTRVLLMACCSLVLLASDIRAEDDQKVSLAGGKFTMSATGEWTKKTPRVNLIEAEFAVPGAKDDAKAGRLTVMASGGGVKANVDRWKGQFSKTDESKVTKEDVAGFETHVVDISGTYKDQRGPFAPATMRKDYRMLGAIIVMEGGPDYFVKFYGPKATVEANAKAFMSFVKSFRQIEN